MNAQRDKEVQQIIDGLGKERDFISKKIIALQKFVGEQNPATNDQASFCIKNTINKQIKALIEYLGDLDDLIQDIKNGMDGAKGLKGIVERL